ncbi:hypothetical protein ACFPU1_07210 [Thalassorhabdus alkalitolerans]|uniref:Uncharacterized protein n=1 Tax=Thalassorhabdus alkalitolerans TaxID=2282697 RepID=A0ABW0YR30_9BACI|nr:hypothetical protein [Thalassobacillus sp. C254]
MNKLLTGLAVWTLFMFIMGMLFPIQTTSGANQFGMILQSYTIYGFFSLIPIVFFGSIVSFIADFLARQAEKHFNTISFILHLIGGSLAYLFTYNIDITIMAMIAAMLFFVADRSFWIISRMPNRQYMAKNLPIVLGVVGVTAMVMGSSM